MNASIVLTSTPRLINRTCPPRYGPNVHFIAVPRRSHVTHLPLLNCSAENSILTQENVDHLGPVESKSIVDRLSRLVSSPYDGEIAQLAIPILLSNMIFPISTAIDGAVVGQLGTIPFSGVALANIILLLVTTIASFSNKIVAPYIARKMAETKHDQASMYIAKNLWFSVIAGLAISGLLAFNAETILLFFRPTPEIIPSAVTYMRIVGSNIPFCLGLFCCASALRGKKSLREMMTTTVATSLTNLFLDIVFVFGCNWGVAGVAWATVCGNMVGFAMSFRYLLKQKVLQARHLFTIPSAAEMWTLLQDGMKLSLRNGLFFSMMVLGSLLIAREGSVQHASFEACRQVSLFVFTCYTAVDQAVQVLGARYIGLKKLSTARGIIIRALQISSGVTAAVVCMMVLVSKYIVRLFTTNPDVVATFSSSAPYILSLLPLSAAIAVIDGAIIGASKFTVSSVAQAMSFITAIVLLCSFHQLGTMSLVRVWMIIRLGTILSGCVTIPYLFSKRWSPYAYSFF